MTKAVRLRPTIDESQGLGRVARTSVMWAYVRTGVYGIIAIPATVILARLLSPTDFGIAAAATFFGQFAARLSNGGMGTAIIRIKELHEDHISTVFVINAAVTTVAVIALLAGAPYIGRFYGTPEIGWILPIVALNFAVGSLSMIQQALLSRDLRYREMATIGSIDIMVASIAAVVFAFFGFRYWSLVLGDVCGGIVKWAYGIKLCGWRLRTRFVPSAARELMSFAMGAYAKRTLEHFTQNVDNLVIGRVLGVTALGFYDKAFSSVNRVFNKLTVVGPGVSFRIFSIIQDDFVRFQRAYRKVIMTVTLVGYFIFGALGTMGPHLIVVAFGEQWQQSVFPFQVLCVSFALKLLNSFATSAAQARGWIWPLVWRQVLQVVCIVVGVALAARWGIEGAAIAVLGATVAMFFLTQTVMRKATGLGWTDILEPQIPAVTTSALLIAILWGIDIGLKALLLSPQPFVILIAQAAACVLYAVAFARWCPFAEARELMHEVVSDFSPAVARFLWRDLPPVEKKKKKKKRGDRGNPDHLGPPVAIEPQVGP
jgi:O-antigen/teichoic acid export membrane protein